jgi:hypothetical protein
MRGYMCRTPSFDSDIASFIEIAIRTTQELGSSFLTFCDSNSRYERGYGRQKEIIDYPIECSLWRPEANLDIRVDQGGMRDRHPIVTSDEPIVTTYIPKDYNADLVDSPGRLCPIYFPGRRLTDRLHKDGSVLLGSGNVHVPILEYQDQFVSIQPLSRIK